MVATRRETRVSFSTPCRKHGVGSGSGGSATAAQQQQGFNAPPARTRSGIQGDNGMKVATFRWGGRRTVGVVSQDGSEVTPLATDARLQSVGALALIEDMVAGKPRPPAAGPRLPISAIELEAPLPRPRRN